MKSSIIHTFLFALFILSILATSCGQENQQQKRKTPTTSKSEPTRELSVGERVYKENCVLCHGSNGRQMLSGAKDLSISTLNMAERIQIIRHGKSTMLPYEGKLSADEIKSVAEYLDTFISKEN